MRMSDWSSDVCSSDLRVRLNTFGHLFRVTTFGESHGPAIGCGVDGCPPDIAIAAGDFAHDLARRATGRTRHTSARHDADAIEILSGVYEGRTTGTPIALLVRNTDARSKDYDRIARQFRPGHADSTYWQTYGTRDPRGGGRSAATAPTMRESGGGPSGGRVVVLGRTPGVRVERLDRIARQCRPGHAGEPYWRKYGTRGPRGGGRSSARGTTMRVAAAVIAKKWLAERFGVWVRGHLAQIGDVVPCSHD